MHFPLSKIYTNQKKKIKIKKKIQQDKMMHNFLHAYGNEGTWSFS